MGSFVGSGSLTEKPFEPLHRATPKDLTLKVPFLLATTSAHRVSEMHIACTLHSEPMVRTHGLFKPSVPA